MAFVKTYQVAQEPGSIERDIDLGTLYPTDQCFVCGRPLTCENLVYWAGFPNQIWMHHACAQALGCGLIADYVRGKREGARR